MAEFKTTIELSFKIEKIVRKINRKILLLFEISQQIIVNVIERINFKTNI